MPVLGLIPDGDGVGLDRDAPLTLEVHRIQDLLSELSGRDRARNF